MNSSLHTAEFCSPILPRSGTPSAKSRDVLRIVQVETFYQPYLDQFYAARPELMSASHAEQITALLAGGFSALHNIAPYLEPLGYEAHFIVANDATAQRAWIRENGITFPSSASVSFADVLRAQIDALDPDILYFSDATSFGGGFVDSLKRRPRLVVGWHAAPIPPGTDWSKLDLFVSALSAMREMAARMGARATEAYMPGFPEWLPANRGSTDETEDIVFTGSYTPVQHARRNQFLQRIGEQAMAQGFGCAYYLTTSATALPDPVARWRRDPVFGVDMHRALMSGRVVFDARSSMTAQGPDGALVDVAGQETANMRLFEATGSGAFLLTERMANLSRYFDVGKDIETFADDGELREKIRHYLDHPEERLAIAAAGRRRCLEEHGMSRRIHVFDGLLRGHLPATSSVAMPSTTPAPAPTAVRHFCTYFDASYAVRGLAMMASVSRFLPDACFYVLCLDDTAARIVADQRPSARVVRLAELEAFDPDLAACRATRSKFEYYFTCTPCLPRYVFHRETQADMVTYLDADLFFYQSPEMVFAEISAASVAIAPHRFTPKLAPGRLQYGRYNVSWVSWRNDPEGRRCLEDYRADCLNWCYDRLEGDRFADQKYLDAWPTRYKGVHELTSKGMNLALWNVDDCTLGERDGVIHADRDPLVFMHFHGVKHVGPASWDLRFREYDVTGNQPFLTEGLYRPYLSLLQGSFDTLAPIYGLTVSGDPRFAAEKKALPPAPLQPGVIRYRIIDRAQATALSVDDGWAFADVADRQDDSFAALIAEMRAGRPRLDFRVAGAAVAAAGMERPSLLEVGCASGYYRHVFEHLVPGGVRYLGADKSPALIELARRKHPDLRFDVAAAERLPYPDGAVDIVYNGVSLMHIVDYEAAIAEARRVARRWCIFHTVPVLQQRPTSFLSKEAYGRPVAEIIINEAELRLLFARYGLIIRKMWESIPYDLSAVLGEPTPTRTFLCEVTDPLSADQPALLNIGCGVHFHTDWANIDVQPRSVAVMGYDVRHPLPYPDGTFDMVYHSHVLEHLPRAAAPGFIADCCRTLKPGGVIRIAVPDLERIAREYVRQLDQAAAGDGAAAARYDWILIELLDQIGRHQSGGEMQAFLASDPLPAEDYILSRIGDEGRALITGLRAQRGAPPPPALSDEALGRFRRSGEAHLWMYDRFSLRRLLEESGLTECRIVSAQESALPGYVAYGLDVMPDGSVRKPDSLFMEARKPLT